MPILNITTLREPNRKARTVDEFYYSEDKPLPYGMRAMTADMIRDGKILNRYVCLHESGDTLTIVTMFRDINAWDEWHDHPVLKESLDKWADRGWSWDTQTIHCNEIVDVAKWSNI